MKYLKALANTTEIGKKQKLREKYQKIKEKFKII